MLQVGYFKAQSRPTVGQIGATKFRGNNEYINQNAYLLISDDKWTDLFALFSYVSQKAQSTGCVFIPGIEVLGKPNE